MGHKLIWILPSQSNFFYTHESRTEPLTTYMRSTNLLPLARIHCWFTKLLLPLYWKLSIYIHLRFCLAKINLEGIQSAGLPVQSADLRSLVGPLLTYSRKHNARLDWLEFLFLRKNWIGLSQTCLISEICLKRLFVVLSKPNLFKNV